jgi:hypothetical protein
LYTFLSSPMHATCPVYLIHLDLICLISNTYPDIKEISC